MMHTYSYRQGIRTRIVASLVESIVYCRRVGVVGGGSLWGGNGAREARGNRRPGGAPRPHSKRDQGGDMAENSGLENFGLSL